MAVNLLEAQSMSTVEAFGRGQPLARVVQQTLTTYWSYFSPAFLFLNGGPSLNAATQQAGVFLLSVAVLLPVGIWALLRPQTPDYRQPHAGMPWLLLIGLLLAPVLPTLKGMPHVVQRTLTLLPFVVLIASYGVLLLWESRARTRRALAVALVAAMPLQFAFFYADYLTGYRIRSAPAYDRTAFVETSRALLDAEAGGGVPAFYLTAPLYDVSAKWRFYATKAGRADLLARTRYFDGDLSKLRDVPPGSLAVLEAESSAIDPGVASGGWSIERRVVDLAGRPTLTVLRRR
jgi:hypothetical protein